MGTAEVRADAADQAHHGLHDPRIGQLYRDCRDLARYIARARREIAEIRPEELKAEKLPRAGRELEAIVRATEDATNTIMEAAETIIAADGADAEVYKTTVGDACMRIFEACSFQDITGQRITKVVQTLTYIEERLNALQSAWGPDLEDAPGAVPERTGEAALLNGPALAGEGVDQDEVDALLNGGGPSPGAAKPSQADIDQLFD